MRAIPSLVLASLIATAFVSQYAVAAEGHSRTLTVNIAEDGKCKLTVEPTAELSTGDESEKAVAIKSLNGAQTSRLENGQHRIVYDFSKFQSADDLVPTALRSDPQKEKEFTAQVSIDKDEGVLVLTPVSKQRAMLPFPRTLKLPVETSVAVRAFAGKTLIVQYAMGTGVLVVSLHGEGSPETPSGFVTVGWRADAGKGAWNQVLKFRPGDNRRRGASTGRAPKPGRRNHFP